MHNMLDISDLKEGDYVIDHVYNSNVVSIVSAVNTQIGDATLTNINSKIVYYVNKGRPRPHWIERITKEAALLHILSQS